MAGRYVVRGHFKELSKNEKITIPNPCTWRHWAAFRRQAQVLLGTGSCLGRLGCLKLTGYGMGP